VSIRDGGTNVKTGGRESADKRLPQSPCRRGYAGDHWIRCAQCRLYCQRELEDATGAGDVFAAAVLASLTSQRLQVELGAVLGLNLARHKMRSTVTRRSALPNLASGFLQQTQTPVPEKRRPIGVILVHDGHSQRGDVRRFVEQRCGIPVHEIDAATVADTQVAALMPRLLARSSFAICLLTGGSRSSPAEISARSRADHHVVHQAGILQGRYGFGRVAILVEEGCDTFSNIAGLVRLHFPVGRVSSVFLELERMLQREGLMDERGGRSGRFE
jgi:predicted nucleotide-binding protein